MNTFTIANRFLLLALMSMVVAGCAAESGDDTSDKTSGNETVDTSRFVLATAPENAIAVLQVRDTAQDDDEVVITGRIGGSTHPFVDGAAAFTIIDASLPACGDAEDCNCPTPWDYCCETAEDIIRHSATIKFLDENQRPHRFDPKAAFNVKELQTVAVQGTAKRDDAGNLTVIAKKIFVQK